MEQSEQNWRRCSTCKKPIGFQTKYYTCSVSTCNGQRTGYVFCSMQCFETHLPGARHRDAGAIENISPKMSQGSTNQPSPPVAGQRIIIKNTPQSMESKTINSSTKNQPPQEVLIIASRLKEYIQAKAEMNTSASVMDILSDKVRALCDEAIESARRDGRKTVMDRDF